MRLHIWPRLAAILVIPCLAVSLPVAAQRDDPRPRAWVGVLLQNAPDAPAADGVSAGGVDLKAVVEDGPAARAGLRARDRVVAVDGVTIRSSAELLARLRQLEPGSSIELTVERRGDTRAFDLRLDERPANTSRLRIRQGWVGVEAIDLPPKLRVHFGSDEESGVMLSEVEPFSPAESAGLRIGDIVFEVDGVEVDSSRALERLVGGAGIGNTIEIGVLRDGVELIVEALVDRRPPENREPPSSS